MWIFLPGAFIVLDAHPKLPQSLVAHARRPGDIESVFPGADVRERPHDDYRYRAVLPRHLVANELARRIHEIDYTQLRRAIADRTRHHAYARVWRDMRRYQGQG